MADIRVIVVEPKNPGNLGSIARVMKNFGFDELITVNAPKIPYEDYFRSMKGREILEKRKNVDSLKEAIRDLKMVIGTSGVISKSRNAVLRRNYNTKEIASLISNVKGKVGIVFGREDIGLTNEELSLCDLFMQIPTSEDYPIMNVSHAVAVALYEIYASQKVESRDVIDRDRLDRLVLKFKENLIRNNYPKHRINKTELLFRRIMARAGITEYEYRVLMGTIGCKEHSREQ